MKRIFWVLGLILLVCFCLCCSDLKLNNLFNISENYKNNKHLNLGFIFEKYETNNYKKYMTGDKVVGECVEVDCKNVNINKIADKLGLMITNKYYVGEMVVIEGVSSKVNYALKNRRENIQIAIKGDKATIASPIIYGSY